MGLHGNARLGLAGRRALVADVEAGCSCRESACKWWRRWSEATLEQRRSLVCLEDRSSRPRRYPRLLAASEQERICAARRRSGWGPRLIAGEVGHPHATVWRTLKRAGISRPPRQPRERPRLYEWPCPGDRLHIDSKRFVRFSRPGHAVTGDRHTTSAEKRMRIGYEWVHSLVDVECPRFRRQQWALGYIYRTTDHRAQALSHWLNYYNKRRPHSSLGRQPPISRDHNVPRQDT